MTLASDLHAIADRLHLAQVGIISLKTKQGATMWDWVNTNKEWFFSGLGVTLLAACGWFIRRAFAKPGENAAQNQRSGSFSKNTQIGSISVRSEKDGK